jgi:DNA modification methylase/transposase-like protein
MSNLKDIDESILEKLRHIEGFPLGDIEDIISLSNSPIYTVYPNRFISDFVENFGKRYNCDKDDYHKNPYVGDISEGRNDKLYQAHSYHTKVPYKAIQKFIEHYTEEGDLVFDGFSGTGMTALAAITLNRNAIISDLSPYATFIGNGYLLNVDTAEFNKLATQLINEVKNELSWLYETTEEDLTKSEILYTVWSDIYICNYCSAQNSFWNLAVNENEEILKEFSCPSCNANLTKQDITQLRDGQSRVLQKMVALYLKNGKKKFKRRVNSHDETLWNRIENTEIPYWYPTEKIMFKGRGWGDMYVPKQHLGIYAIDHFYYKRTLMALSAIWNKIQKIEKYEFKIKLMWSFLSVQNYLNKKQSYFGGGGGQPGTLTISDVIQEKNVFDVLLRKIKRVVEAENLKGDNLSKNYRISTQSCTDLSNIPENSIDYIFSDPPFGRNLMYSELNFLNEGWLKVFTNNKEEAIVNRSQNKNRDDYYKLMCSAFKEYFRIIKPKRWITIEFHNKSASIWNAIQEAIVKAGFVVAQVAVLDKGSGTFKQLASPGSVKNDLVINAYKPAGDFVDRFLTKLGLGFEKEFVQQHLSFIRVERNVERTSQMLYSKMLAYYIQHGFEINMNSNDFYNMLEQYFYERDGFWFTEEEIDEYEKNKQIIKVDKEDLEKGSLFIMDERSAIVWVNSFLDEPKSYNDIYLGYTKALLTNDDKIPELMNLLEENFITENGIYRRPEILERQEIEMRRHKRLLKEFYSILEQVSISNKKIKSVRKEAIIVGFTECYMGKRFEDILKIGKKLPQGVIDSSTEIYDFIDIAESKVEGY